MWALSHNVTVLTPRLSRCNGCKETPQRWYSPQRCDATVPVGEELRCYVEGFSVCDGADGTTIDHRTPYVPGGKAHNPCFPDGKERLMMHVTEHYRHRAAEGEYTGTPSARGGPDAASGLSLRTRERGPFFAGAAILKHILRPTAQMRRSEGFWSATKTLFAALQDPANQPVLAMHVRRGDVASCKGDLHGLDFNGSTDGSIRNWVRRCFPDQRFLAEAQHLVDRYGYRTIFVATDDDGLLDRLQGWGRKPPVDPRYRRLFGEGGVSWLWNRHRHRKPKYDSHRDEFTIENALQSDAVDAWSEVEAMLVDLEAAALCSGLLGQFRSQASRLMYELQFARRQGGCTHPFVSLDERFCSDFMRFTQSTVEWEDAAQTVRTTYVC
mmetsp:Transcript_32059/g.96506  ORF Transcript_32059/g.96506 Transcript_32059/m.96506 type:complete len:382 (-) Transcript_32059:225-1370(-)